MLSLLAGLLLQVGTSNLRGGAKGRNCAVPGGAIDRLNSAIELHEAGAYKCATTTQTTTTLPDANVCPKVGAALEDCCEIVRSPCEVCSCDAANSEVLDDSCLNLDVSICPVVGLTPENPIVCLTPCTTTTSTTATTTTTPTVTPKAFNGFRKLLKAKAIGAPTFGVDVCPEEQAILSPIDSSAPIVQGAFQVNPDRPGDKTCFETFCTVGIPQESADSFAPVTREVPSVLYPVEIRRMVPWNLGIFTDDYTMTIKNEWFINAEAKNKLILFSQSDSVMQAESESGNDKPNLELTLFKESPNFGTPAIQVRLTMNPPAVADQLLPITRTFEFGFPPLRDGQTAYFNSDGRTYLAVELAIKMPERRISVSVETCTHLFAEGLCTKGLLLDASPQSPIEFDDGFDGSDLSGYSPRSCVETIENFPLLQIPGSDRSSDTVFLAPPNDACNTFVGSGSRLQGGVIKSTRQATHVDGCPVSFDIRTTGFIFDSVTHLQPEDSDGNP